MLSSAPLPGWSCGVPIRDCCNGFSLSPSDWRHCSHPHRPDPSLPLELSLCSAPVLALPPGCVSQAQHMPSTVCNSAYFSFSLTLELAHPSLALVPTHRFISPATPAWIDMISGHHFLLQTREVVLNVPPGRCTTRAVGVATKKADRALFLEAWFCICGWFS